MATAVLLGVAASAQQRCQFWIWAAILDLGCVAAALSAAWQRRVYTVGAWSATWQRRFCIADVWTAAWPQPYWAQSLMFGVPRGAGAGASLVPGTSAATMQSSSPARAVPLVLGICAPGGGDCAPDAPLSVTVGTRVSSAEGRFLHTHARNPGKVS